MQEAQTQTETGKCCGKNAGHRGKCGSPRNHEANTNASPSALEVLQQRFARGEIDTAEFEEKRRLITSA